jgi:hypothetical protein
MPAVICTLFEKHYHYGVAALVNSLYQNGFNGDIYAGYKGKLPSWCSKAEPKVSDIWINATTLKVGEKIRLHFLPLTTDSHLTNYKPDFMLELWDGPAFDADAIVYLDPDIVVTAAWSSFETWLNCGIAVCEDVNSPIPEFHPKRVAWREYYSNEGVKLNFKDSIYVNGGFVGVNQRNRNFLNNWKVAQDLMSKVIGGLSYSSLSEKSIYALAKSAFAPFGTTDQDALNVAIEMSELPISIVGQEVMAFKAGEAMLPHALGQPKPWRRHPLIQMLLGVAPRLIDKEYWKYANGPIRTYSDWMVKRRKVEVKIASLASRFYIRR